MGSSVHEEKENDVPLRHARISALEIARKSAGLTAAEMAKAIGVSASHISQIERGWRTPSLAVKQRLAALLRSPVDELFPPTATPALLRTPGVEATSSTSDSRATGADKAAS